MSDELYIDIFRYLADDAHDDRALEFAEVVWEHMLADDDEIEYENFGIDDSLLALGLASFVRDPESGEVILAYLGEDEFLEFEEVEQ